MNKLELQKSSSTVDTNKVRSAVNEIYVFLTIGQPLKENINSIMTQHFGNDANGSVKISDDKVVYIGIEWYILVLKTI